MWLLLDWYSRSSKENSRNKNHIKCDRACRSVVPELARCGWRLAKIDWVWAISSGLKQASFWLDDEERLCNLRRSKIPAISGKSYPKEVREELRPRDRSWKPNKSIKGWSRSRLGLDYHPPILYRIQTSMLNMLQLQIYRFLPGAKVIQPPYSSETQMTICKGCLQDAR